MSKSLKKHWEQIGSKDPYFAVLTSEEYKTNNLSDEHKSSFFQSGQEHIDFVVDQIQRYIAADFNPRRSLDFGCGTGRLVIPIAKRFGYVLGIDISVAMLQEARQNCKDYHVEFAESDDTLSGASGQFDFIHSYIVLQHIPTSHGVALFKRLVDLLTDGGVAALHLTYHREAPAWRRAICWIQKNIPFMSNIANVCKGKSFNYPFIQMNSYNLNTIFSILQKEGIEKTHVHFTNHDGHFGVILFFQKPGLPA